MDESTNLLYDILNKYDPSLSTTQASMLLDEIVTSIEAFLGTTYSEVQNTEH